MEEDNEENGIWRDVRRGDKIRIVGGRKWKDEDNYRMVCEKRKWEDYNWKKDRIFKERGDGSGYSREWRWLSEKENGWWRKGRYWSLI